MQNKLRNPLKKWLAPALLTGAALALAVPAEALLIMERDGTEFHMEVHTVGRLQALDHDADSKAAAGFGKHDVNPGFQHAIGNLGWRLVMQDYVDVFFDVTIASRVKADTMWGHQGYMLIKQVPEASALSGANVFFDFFDVKAGQFIADFGNEIHRRSLNADVQRNPLVGNPVVSPHATEVAVEVIHNNPAGFGAMVGMGSGVATENLGSGSRPSFRAKAWTDIPGANGLELAGSFYRVNHGDAIGRGSNLFRTERLGGQYSGVWDDGNAPGQVMIGDGTSVTAWQLDATWSADDRTTLWGHVGRASDDRGATDEAWYYYGVTGQYYAIQDALYVAARYSAADASRFQSDRSNDGSIQRWQVGGGLWILPEMLLLKV